MPSSPDFSDAIKNSTRLLGRGLCRPVVRGPMGVRLRVATGGLA
jgi:hypothetical protein